MPLPLSVPSSKRRLMLPADYDNESDDASVCSTLTVERVNTKLDTTAPSVTATKRVSFHHRVTIVPSGYSIDEQDVESLWYNKRDFSAFKAYTTAIGRTVAETEMEANSHLSYTSVLERAYRSCSTGKEEASMTGAERARLEKWLGATTCCVGAERAIVRQLRKEKRRSKREYIAAVLEFQDTLATCADNDDVEEEIRMQCEQISRPARLFAHTMAAAYIASGSA